MDQNKDSPILDRAGLLKTNGMNMSDATPRHLATNQGNLIKRSLEPGQTMKTFGHYLRQRTAVFHRRSFRSEA